MHKRVTFISANGTVTNEVATESCATAVCTKVIKFLTASIPMIPKVKILGKPSTKANGSMATDAALALSST